MEICRQFLWSDRKHHFKHVNIIGIPVTLRNGVARRHRPGLVFFTFYIKLLWLNFNGRVCCSEATLWPSEYICGRLEWVCTVWYATWSPHTAAPRWLSRYVQPISIVPHFVWQKRAAELMASDSRIPPQWGQTHAQSVYLCHLLKAGPHWLPEKVNRREWIGRQRGMLCVRNWKGSEFQWFGGFGPFFVLRLHHSQKLWKHEVWQAQATNLCVNALAQEREVMQFSCSTALSCFICCLLSDCSIIIMAITTSWKSAQWGDRLLTQSPAYRNISQFIGCFICITIRC